MLACFVTNTATSEMWQSIVARRERGDVSLPAGGVSVALAHTTPFVPLQSPADPVLTFIKMFVLLITIHV
uniref:Uncharacterized protein n=1 Tax=Timema poppense TaxID=170557 RepID=A0A7R9HA47_TIMPO|nr:unnamed protein product [Timema poppensis]